MTELSFIELIQLDRPSLLKIVLSAYLGETCPYCLKKFEVLDDLKGTVWNGYTEYGRIAHGDCLFLAHPEVKQKAKA